MTIITNVRSKGKGSTDPRFKNGVFVNRRGQRIDQAAQQRQLFRDHYPPAHGWTFSYWHDQLDQPVYHRDDGDGISIVYDGEGQWVVQFEDGHQIGYIGLMAQITADVVKEAESLARTRYMQAAWEAAHPDMEIGGPF